MTIALTAPTISDPDPLVLSTTQYYTRTQPRGNFVPFYMETSASERKKGQYNYSDSVNDKNKEEGDEISYSDIVDTFFLPPGLGATCLLIENGKNKGSINQTRYVFTEECEKFQAMGSNMPTDKHIEVLDEDTDVTYYTPCECKADGVGLTCDNKAATDPPHWRTGNGDVLQDVTSTDDLDNYLLYTTEKYRRHRYLSVAFHITILLLFKKLKLM